MKFRKQKSSKKATDPITLILKDEVEDSVLFEATVPPGKTVLHLPAGFENKMNLTVIATNLEYDSKFVVSQEETNYSTSVGTPAEWTPQ